MCSFEGKVKSIFFSLNLFACQLFKFCCITNHLLLFCLLIHVLLSLSRKKNNVGTGIFVIYMQLFPRQNQEISSFFAVSSVYRLQGDHNILFQMPEILLFDIFEPKSCDGVSTGGVYPSRIRCANVLPRENFKKQTQKESISCRHRLFFFNSFFLMWFIVQLSMNCYAFR